MRKIPAEFQIFGKTISTILNPDLMEYDIKGRASESRSMIEVCMDMEQLTEEDIEVTYLHEVMHVLLDSLGYYELSKDERFVDLMCRGLHQFLSTADIWVDEDGKPKVKHLKKRK